MQILNILIEGYAHPGENNEYFASPTTSLIVDNGKHILVDPGTNAELLLQALASNNTQPSDIDLIFLSHYHPDHFLNIRLFTDVDIYDGSLIWSKDRETPYENVIPETDIHVIATPGHAAEQASLIIETQDLGKICIAQDVFWWEDGQQKSDTVEELLSLVDPFASDTAALQESRKKVLASGAQWIVPGHGKIFKNPGK